MCLGFKEVLINKVNIRQKVWIYDVGERNYREFDYRLEDSIVNMLWVYE